MVVQVLWMIGLSNSCVIVFFMIIIIAVERLVFLDCRLAFILSLVSFAYQSCSELGKVIYYGLLLLIDEV